jgi:extradiol dioxygenase family protein
MTASARSDHVAPASNPAPMSPFHLAFPVHDLAPEDCGLARRNAVDGHGVPVRHFGIVLPMADWQAMAGRLRARGIEFVIEPYTRFAGQPGEQSTMFFLDPSGNALEIKAFADITKLFAK